MLILLVIHGRGAVITWHIGRWESGQGQPDAVRAGHAAVGGGDDTAYSPDPGARSERAFGTHQGLIPARNCACGRHNGQGRLRNAYVRDVPTCRRSVTEFAASEPGRTARHFVPVPGLGPSWTTSCVSRHNDNTWARTTVCVLPRPCITDPGSDRQPVSLHRKARVTVSNIWMGH